MPRDGTIEGRAREADGVNIIGVACTNHSDPILVTHPVVLVLLKSISQVYVVLTHDIIVLCLAIFLPS